MNETAIIGERIEVLPTERSGGAAWGAFSWSLAIAGALAAAAISFILIALGSGIGLSLASPYGSGPSAGTLTVLGAVWLIMAQSLGFAAGGYLAARLARYGPYRSASETTFLDAAHGLMVWAIGVIFGVIALAAASAFAVGTGAFVTGMFGSGAAQGSVEAVRRNAQPEFSAYYLDTLFRPMSPGAAPAPAAAAPADATTQPAPTRNQTDLQREEVARIMTEALRQGRLGDEDRAYVARVVAARSGISQQEAERRVTDVENRARAAAKETADKAAKAASYFSFWTFMALLFGAVAAVLGGMVGGELRDQAEPESPVLAR
jgi:hypothetical protein